MHRYGRGPATGLWPGRCRRTRCLDSPRVRRFAEHGSRRSSTKSAVPDGQLPAERAARTSPRRLPDRRGSDRLDRRPRADRLPRGALRDPDRRRGGPPGEPRLDRQHRPLRRREARDGSNAAADADRRRSRRLDLDPEAAVDEIVSGLCRRSSTGPRAPRRRRRPLRRDRQPGRGPLRPRRSGPSACSASSCPRPTPRRDTLEPEQAERHEPRARDRPRGHHPDPRGRRLLRAPRRRDSERVPGVRGRLEGKIVLPACSAATASASSPSSSSRPTGERREARLTARPTARSSPRRTSSSARARCSSTTTPTGSTTRSPGTPNRLEYDQGFFVKNGDGAADIKPIAHLYKTQVYQLAELPRRARGDPDAAADDRHLLASAEPGGVLLLARLVIEGRLRGWRDGRRPGGAPGAGGVPLLAEKNARHDHGSEAQRPRQAAPRPAAPPVVNTLVRPGVNTSTACPPARRGGGAGGGEER